jgi:hypothetical protein
MGAVFVFVLCLFMVGGMREECGPAPAGWETANPLLVRLYFSTLKSCLKKNGSRGVLRNAYVL